jgi:hypothetical protein
MLAREALGIFHASLYAEGIAVSVAMTPFALLHPSTVLRRRSLRRGPPSSRRHCFYTPTVTRALPREVYAEGCRQRSVRRGHNPIRRRLEALGI